MLGTKDMEVVASIAPSTVATASATLSAAFEVAALKGPQSVVVAFAAASSRTKFKVTVKGCDTAAGTYDDIKSEETDSDASGVLRVDIGGEYLPKYIKVELATTGAATVASAVILTTK